MRNTVIHGDSAEVLKTFPDECLDAVVTDPPYGLGTRQPTPDEIRAYLVEGSKLDHGGDFMGREWDMPHVPLWREVYRAMKPGTILMAFAGTRTMDLMAAGIKAAGFNYICTLAWCYGQGFPKSLNISKAIDKLKGAERPVLQERTMVQGGGTSLQMRAGERREVQANVTGPATEEAKKWEGWGTALKPAWEPVLTFSKGPTLWQKPRIPFLYNAKANKNDATVGHEVENDHPTKKPLDVMQWLVKLAAPEGSLILDPFLGSGTTAHACLKEGRDYVGIERDPHFVDVSRNRLRASFPADAMFDMFAEVEQE
jgi:DNA modification methylase